jgi:hypothetical protein
MELIKTILATQSQIIYCKKKIWKIKTKLKIFLIKLILMKSIITLKETF